MYLYGGFVMNKKSNYVVQAGILAMAGILSRFIGLIRRFPMEHIIGDKGNGYYSVAYEVYAIMLIISCYSMPVAISKIVSAKISNKQFKSAERVFQCALIMAAIVGAILVIICDFLGDFIAAELMLEPMSAFALKVLGPAIFVVSIMSVFRGYFQGMGTMIPTAVSQIIEQLFVLVGTLIGADLLFDYGEKVGRLMHNEDFAPSCGAAGASIGPVAGSVIGLVFLIVVYILYKKVNVTAPHRINSENVDAYSDVFRILFITVIPFVLSTLVFNISNVIDIIIYNNVMIKKGLGNIKAYNWGVYAGKYKILVYIPVILANAICSSLVPTLTRLTAKQEYRQAKEVISKSIRYAMLVVIPGVIGLAVLARPVISMMFKGEINLAVNLLHVGAILAVFYSIATITTGVLHGIDKMMFAVKNAVIALVIHIALLYGMLQLGIGINAVIFANIIFAVIVCASNYFYIKRFLNYRVDYIRTFVVPLIASVIMGVVIGVISLLINKLVGNILTVIICTLIGIIVYAVAIILLRGVSEDDFNDLPGGQALFLLVKKFKLM